uniref:Ig-like domain-containing protein n=1 Tax=Oreochromis niloticus TaxID=8128 RepID=A0A669ENR5_ORENI
MVSLIISDIYTLFLTDSSCTEFPVFTPSALVVKYGDPASVTCDVCQKDCSGDVFGLEHAVGKVTQNGTTMLWTVDRLTEWGISVMCYYNADAGDQCCSALDITIYQPPESVSISFVNHTGMMFENQQYTLQCSVQNVAPVQSLTVTFYRGNTALGHLQSNSEQKKPVNETFTLNITPSREHDGAQYWCETKLELGPAGPQRPPVVTSEKLPAIVHYGPELKEPPNPDVITITEGDTLHLNCSSVGNPSPSYTWTLSTNSSSYSGSVLTIKSVGFEHEGQYICTVSNTVGTVTKEFNIDVQGECCQILPGKRVTEVHSQYYFTNQVHCECFGVFNLPGINDSPFLSLPNPRPHLNPILQSTPSHI